jgi:hypothetical protein
MAAGDIDRKSDIVVSIPLSRWRLVRGFLTFGLTALAFAFMGLIFVNSLLTEQATGLFRRCFYLGLISFSMLVAVVNLMILRLVWRGPLTILTAGIELQGMLTPWDEVDNCYWAYYSPGFLNIRTRHARLIVPIPQSYRASVEYSLRRLGKWRVTDASGKA